MVVERVQGIAAAKIATEADLLDYICRYINAQGFTFSRDVVADYYISLKAKPFVILTGISGTGKTRLSHLMADALTGPDSGHYLLVPVAPDWTDDRLSPGLLQRDPGEADRDGLLQILQLVFRREEGALLYLPGRDEPGQGRALLQLLPQQHGDGLLPPNFFITGTVNIDESTYQFSKKVLDRANTIEFNDVYLFDRPSDGALYSDFTWDDRQVMFDLFLRVRETVWDEDVLFTLDGINAILVKRNLQFAYRVRDEILRFMTHSQGLLEKYAALDMQVLQKVLPRLSGTREQLEKILLELLSYLLMGNEEPLPAPIKDLYLLDPSEYEECLFPKSAKKVARMLARVREDGFATFYE